MSRCVDVENCNFDTLRANNVKSMFGISSTLTDVNTAIGENAYWYGLGLKRDQNGSYVTLGGFYGLKLFSRGAEIIIDERDIKVKGNITFSGKIIAEGGIEDKSQSG